MSKNEPTLASCSFVNFHCPFTFTYFICLQIAEMEITQHWRLEAVPHWHAGKHITKCLQRSCWSMAKRVRCMCEGERTSLWTSAKIKPALFSATNSLPRKMRYVSRHFCCSYLKANEVSKSEEPRKVEYAYNFWKCADAVYRKLSKSVHTWRNYRCGLTSSDADKVQHCKISVLWNVRENLCFKLNYQQKRMTTETSYWIKCTRTHANEWNAPFFPCLRHLLWQVLVYPFQSLFDSTAEWLEYIRSIVQVTELTMLHN